MSDELKARRKQIDDLLREGRVEEARELSEKMSAEMFAYQSRTDEVEREGKFQEALERHIWFHDNALEYAPSMSGVRVSFALSDWKDLGEKYSPALAALVETRDRKAREAAETGGTWQLFQDVAAINRTLEDEQATVELFEILDAKFPECARDFWNVAERTIIPAKRFDLIRKYGFDTLRAFEEAESYFKDLADGREISAEFGPVVTEQFDRFQKNSFVEKCLQIIHTAMTLGDDEGAAEVRTKALAIVDDPRLREGEESGPAAEN